MPVKQESVIRTHLRICLSCLRVPLRVLRDIFPGIDRLDPVHFHRSRLIQGSHDRVRMRGAQEFYDQAVLRSDIVHVYRLSGHKLHRVLFPDRFIYIFHNFRPLSVFVTVSHHLFCVLSRSDRHTRASPDRHPFFSFFHARNAWIPRSCPS